MGRSQAALVAALAAVSALSLAREVRASEAREFKVPPAAAGPSQWSIAWPPAREPFGANALYLEDGPPRSSSPDEAPPAAPAAESTERTVLNGTLYQTAAGRGLIDKGFDFGGYVEASYTYSTSSPPGNLISGRAFDFEHEDPTLNQAVLYAQRAISPAADKWDLGFRVEMLYGADGRLIHANGLNFYGGDAFQQFPENQFDLTQAYVQLNAPIGKGLLFTAGKFVTLLGYETINPTTNPFYSHSVLFGFAIPFTHTGVLVAYPLTDKITLTAGVTRGWEQALKDNNDSIDGIGQVKWVASDKLTLILSGITGPEQTGNNSDYRTVIDLIASYACSEKLTVAVNGDYGFEPGASASGGYAVWGGLAGYASYKLSDMLTLNGRVEWFNDNEGARGFGTDVYEGTAGVTITPFATSKVASGFKVRPEVRVDYASDDVFDGGTQDAQVTLAVDAMFSF